jgi:DNA anti-recombination protein RmuC
MPEISQEAMENKVILAGPFSFTAILRMIRQSYENFRVQKNIYTIINHVKAFEKEFDNFSGEFYKIGDRISSLQKQYDVVSSTRFNQLVRKIDKVKEEGGQIPQGEQKKLLEVGKE